MLFLMTIVSERIIRSSFPGSYLIHRAIKSSIATDAIVFRAFIFLFSKNGSAGALQSRFIAVQRICPSPEIMYL